MENMENLDFLDFVEKLDIVNIVEDLDLDLYLDFEEDMAFLFFDLYLDRVDLDMVD